MAAAGSILQIKYSRRLSASDENQHSSARDEDVARFVDAVLFNFLIAGPDAHAKNYSLLIAGAGQVRLAPLYDIASILPYDDYDLHKVKLSMKIGGEYGVIDIRRRHIERLAKDVKLPADAVMERLKTLAEQLPDALNDEARLATADGLTSPIIDRLVNKMAKRAAACLNLMAEPTA